MTVARRDVLAGAAVLGALSGCALGREGAPPGSNGGADMARGHKLRQGGFPAPTREERAGIVIVGGGVSGLSAGWTLAEAGFDDFRLLELEDETGGNARSGRNAVSAFPLGAHYLPVANEEARALRQLLTRLGMIVGEEGGKPVYDPYQLCADLGERLLWQGRWQEGLIPRSGLSEKEARQIVRFEAEMAEWRDRRGADGKHAFAVPLAHSSTDPVLLALDRRGFGDWLDERGYDAEPLRAYIRYGCRDDYGCEPEDVSAWAGLHYFAGRRGFAANNAGDNQLTWPEGNARLTGLMARRFQPNISTGRVTYRIVRDGDEVIADSFDTARDESVRTRARAAILAIPRFIARSVAPDLALGDDGPDYAPWLVANVTVDRIPAGRGAPLAWDNVSATSESLGYVVATHQSLDSRPKATVLTWYMPLSRMAPASARRLLVERSAEEWRRIVRDDLIQMHPELDGAIRSVDLWRWGHAMARPEPGYIWGPAARARAANHAPLFLAHSDMSGLSLFEEAHYQGVRAAEGAMRMMGHAYESLL